MDMKFRVKARKKARQRRVYPGNFTIQENKMAAKNTLNIQAIALSTSNEQQCTTITQIQHQIKHLNLLKT